MRMLLWIAAWIGVAIWSLFAFAGHALLGVAGDLFVANADIAPLSPEGVVSLSALIDGLAAFGQGAVFFVWAIGSLVILSVPYFASRLFGRRSGAMRLPQRR
jgi:hypothetical protein